MVLETWEKIEDFSDSELVGSVVRIVQTNNVVVKGKVTLTHEIYKYMLVVFDNDPDAEILLSEKAGWVVERQVPKDIRSVRDIVSKPLSVSNRTLRFEDPYGTVREVGFNASTGFNVYPSGTVTIGKDWGSGPMYIKDGISGVMEVI